MEDKLFFYKFLLDGRFDYCLEDCELEALSKMPLDGLIGKLAELSPEDLRCIISKHQQCLKNYLLKFAS